MPSRSDENAARLKELRGGAPERSATVRTLARFAQNTDCSLATVGFASRVDLDRLLDGTSYAVRFGQSPFAFRRGNTFEASLRKNGHKPMRDLLGQHLGARIDKRGTVNLREGFPRSRAGMKARAARTEELLSSLLRAPTRSALLDGAVMTRKIGGVLSFFEADAVAARCDGPIHAGEVKSFPTVDGRADPDKVGAAMAQVSIYILLLQELAGRAGADPSSISSRALLITPRNTGLRPIVTSKYVDLEIERARRILSRVPEVHEIAESMPHKLPSFGRIAQKKRPEQARLDLLDGIVERVGTTYKPSCLSSCGLSRFCRERCHNAQSPERVGGQLIRILPGVKSISRVRELALGERPTPIEAPVAEQLRRAERFRGALIDAG